MSLWAVSAALTLCQVAGLRSTGDVDCIYGLTDPRLGGGLEAVRYVGKSLRPNRRLIEHLRPKDLAAKTHRSYWLKSLLRVGLRPKIIILARVRKPGHWPVVEKAWITRLRNLGADLTNTAEGGKGGGVRGRIFSAATRRKISKALMGNTNGAGSTMTDEGRRRVGEKNRQHRLGTKLSAATKRKIGLKSKGNQYVKGRRMPPEERRQRGLAMKRAWAEGRGRNQYVRSG